MTQIRAIRRIVTGKRTVDGAGVKLVRVIGHDDVKEFDPFLMLDAFDSRNPNDYIKGFPWHPHRGIETITYLVHGDIEHGDSLGNKGSILDGDCQWMTAGSGIIHQEMPQPCDWMFGAQLWLNLPARDKMAAPRYGDIVKAKIPVVDEDDIRIHIVAGDYKGSPGGFTGRHIPAIYLDVEMPAGGEWAFDNDKDATLFIYILQGGGLFGPGADTPIPEKHAVLFGEGDRFQVRAGDDGMRFLLFSGRPLREPIAWGGPIVMNTKAELDLAFRELDEGRFIKG